MKTGGVKDNFLKEVVLWVSFEGLEFISGVLSIGPVVWFCWALGGTGESTWDFVWLALSWGRILNFSEWPVHCFLGSNHVVRGSVLSKMVK